MIGGLRWHLCAEIKQQRRAFNGIFEVGVGRSFWKIEIEKGNPFAGRGVALGSSTSCVAIPIAAKHCRKADPAGMLALLTRTQQRYECFLTLIRTQVAARSIGAPAMPSVPGNRTNHTCLSHPWSEM
jgi:hypothetical protein